MTYRLRENLFWCSCGERVVLLDLAADRYFCLPPVATPAFRRLSEGLEAGEDDCRSLRGLIERGLIVEDAATRASQQAVPLPEPAGDMLEAAVTAPLPAIVRAGFFEAWAAWQLRRRPLLTVARRMEEKGRQAALRPSSSEARLREVVLAFERTTLVFARSGRCLARAVAVHAACCAEGIRPRVVLGVRMDPFRAHAWVQLEDRVVVGEFEQVRLFTRIAVLG